MKKINSIIWDWNGTLLDDLDLCINVINVLLEKRKLPVLDKNRYKEVFSFPVKEYYQSVGFDFTKEAFATPAREFIDLYNQKVVECKLHSSAMEVLNYFQSNGYRQFVLSAMKEETLVKTLRQRGILEFFDG